MMISKKMTAALNKQIGAEYGSYWIYQQMAFALNGMNLKTFAAWFTAQAGEERAHAEKIADYILDQGGEVLLEALPKPKSEYRTVDEICKGALDHEVKITKMINDLVKLAETEKDYATRSFLSWFVNEQVEEVANATQLLEWVKMAQSPGQLLMLENRIMSLRDGD